MRDDRGPWYLLTALIIGIGLGLLIAWRISPVSYVNTSPAALSEADKESYRALVAAAYMSNGDLPRALARLGLLKDPDLPRSLAIQAQRALAEGHPPAEARALGLLAVAVNQGSNPVGVEQQPSASTSTDLPAPSPVLSPSPVDTQPPVEVKPTFTPTPSPTAGTPEPGYTPLPTRTPTPTMGAPFVLQERPKLVCDATLTEPFIMVEAKDASGQPVPGVEVVVTWPGGEEHFFTGLQQEIDLGYADYTMTPGITYTVHASDGGQPASGLSAQECEAAGGQRYYGSWRVIFIQP